MRSLSYTPHVSFTEEFLHTSSVNLVGMSLSYKLEISFSEESLTHPVLDFMIIIIAVISTAQYLTNKSEHTALDMISNNVYIKTSKMISYIVIILHPSHTTPAQTLSLSLTHTHTHMRTNTHLHAPTHTHTHTLAHGGSGTSSRQHIFTVPQRRVLATCTSDL